MPSNPFPNFFNEGLRLISHCPLCESRYSPLEAKVVEEREGVHLVYIKCRKCLSSVIALILSSNLGVSSVGLVTDLSFDDLIKFKDAPNITIDEVIELHQLLEKSGNDLTNFIR